MPEGQQAAQGVWERDSKVTSRSAQGVQFFSNR